MWISNYIHYKVWGEITYPFLNINDCTVKFEIGLVISFHTLLGVWSLIHAGNKVNPWQVPKGDTNINIIGKPEILELL